MGSHTRTITVLTGMSRQAIREAAGEVLEELLVRVVFHGGELLSQPRPHPHHGPTIPIAEVEITVRPARPRAQRARSIEAVQLAVCRHFDLQLPALSSRDRGKGAAFPRHIAMYLCKNLLETSFPEIGRAFGGRDHTTVMSAVRSVAKERVTVPRLREVLDELERELGGEAVEE